MSMLPGAHAAFRLLVVSCVAMMVSGCLGMGGDKSGASASADGDLPSNPSQMGVPGAPHPGNVSATASATATTPADTPAPPRRGSTASVPGHARIQPGPVMASAAPGAPKETVMAAKPLPIAKARKEDVRRAAPVVDTQAPPLGATSIASTGNPKRSAGGLSRSSTSGPSTSLASTTPPQPPSRPETLPPPPQPAVDYSAGSNAKYTAAPSTNRRGPRSMLSTANQSPFINRNLYAQNPQPSAPLPRGEGNDQRFADGNSMPPQYDNVPPPSTSSYNSRPYSNNNAAPRYQAPPPSSTYQESIAGSSGDAGSGDGALPSPQNAAPGYQQHQQTARYSAAPPLRMPGGPEFRRTIAPNDQEVVVITTAFGDVVIQLDAQAAPQTVANFSRLIAEGFYDGTTFHRTIPNFVIQGGDPNSRNPDRSRHGLGGPDYTVPAEIGVLKHIRGAVAMARRRDAENPTRASNGSQFYICVNNNPALNDKYTVFGRVIKGMDVVDTISMQPRDNRDNPLDNIKMQVVMKKRSEIQGLQ
ncbi:MAG: peptidylprolyl isomerase [Candidatus Methylacidiphilales bacterium]